MTVPSFSVGEVLTAQAMNAVGLWRVTSCTVTSSGGTAATASNGVITIGNGNTTLTVNNAFSADYKAYKVIVSSGTLSGSADVGLRMGTATTNYAYNFTFTSYNNTVSASGTSAGTSFAVAGGGSADFLQLTAEIVNPFESNRFTLFNSFMGSGTGAGFTSGQHRTAASYTSFTLILSTGSFGGGNIRVYGYRD